MSTRERAPGLVDTARIAKVTKVLRVRLRIPSKRSYLPVKFLPRRPAARKLGIALAPPLGPGLVDPRLPERELGIRRAPQRRQESAIAGRGVGDSFRHITFYICSS
jgi:hypothetical protein